MKTKLTSVEKALSCLVFQVTSVLFSFLPSAGFAQTITLQNTTSNSCQYTSVSLSSSTGSIVVQCATSPGGVNAPGTIGFSQAASTGTAGTAATIAVQRASASGSIASASVTFTCSGLSAAVLPGSGTLTFPANGVEYITVTPSQLPTGQSLATITCALAGNTAGTSLGQSTHTLTVSAAPAPPSPGTCSGGSATFVYDQVSAEPNRTGYRKTISMEVGQTAAIKFPGSRSVFGTMQYGASFASSALATAPAPEDAQMVVSECPGNFTDIPTGNVAGVCAMSLWSGHGEINTLSAGTPKSWECRLDPAKSYYLNLRWLKGSGLRSTYIDYSFY